MKFGLPISLALHIGVFGGFTFFAAEAKPLAEAKIIPVEILTVAPETNAVSYTHLTLPTICSV